MSEVLLQEVYYYPTLEEAVDDMDRMRMERACDLAFDVDNSDAHRVKVTVLIGEAR